MKLGTMIAGTTHGADIEPLGGDRIDLAVAVARDQDLGGIFLSLQERHHKMLPVPERDDHRREQVAQREWADLLAGILLAVKPKSEASALAGSVRGAGEEAGRGK